MSPNAITAAFAVLERAGLRPPFGSPQEAAQTAGVWRKTIGDATDEALDAAITGWLQSDKGQWWPKPSELRRLLPRAAPKPTVVVEQGWPGSKVAALPDHDRIRVMDAAVAEVALSPLCGKERCGSECTRCIDAAIARADEMAGLDEQPTEVG